MTDKLLLRIARESIEAHLAGRSYKPPIDRHEIDDKSPPTGVFVTLMSKKPHGEDLRGCIGRLERARPSVVQEIAECAVSAATEDPRFDPLTPEELKEVSIELSLLGAAEEVTDVAQLDPKKYGVIMTAGRRRATLLPGIDGVDTVEQQLSIVRRKAGIPAGEPVTLFRYPIRKIME